MLVTSRSCQLLQRTRSFCSPASACTSRKLQLISTQHADLTLSCVCSFAQHPTKGAAAVISLVSWQASVASLRLASLHQPLQPGLPFMHKPNLQHWQFATLALARQQGAAAEDDVAGSQGTTAGPVTIDSVIQAWHLTGMAVCAASLASCCCLCSCLQC